MENNPCKRVSTDREVVELLSSWQRAHKITSINRDLCRELSRSYPEISMDRESVENGSSRQRAQKFGSMDRPSCQEAIEVKSINLDRRNLCQAVVEMLSRRYREAVKQT